MMTAKHSWATRLWQTPLKNMFDRARFVARIRPSVAHRRSHFIERLDCELLEDRNLLAVDVPSVFADFSSLRADANSYDSSHILVRFDESVGNAHDYLQKAAEVALRSLKRPLHCRSCPGCIKSR